MGKTPQEKIDRWVAAAGQENKGSKVIERVVTAGEFLEKNVRLSENEASKLLKGIDFSKPVDVVKLPQKVYVQYKVKHKGIWFTDTGLTPDAVGLSGCGRKRTLYRPAGTVPALRCKAMAIKDTWTPNRILETLSPESKRLGQMTSGGGTQYVVGDKSRMEEL